MKSHERDLSENKISDNLKEIEKLKNSLANIIKDEEKLKDDEESLSKLSNISIQAKRRIQNEIDRLKDEIVTLQASSNQNE